LLNLKAVQAEAASMFAQTGFTALNGIRGHIHYMGCVPVPVRYIIKSYKVRKIILGLNLSPSVFLRHIILFLSNNTSKAPVIFCSLDLKPPALYNG